MYNGVRTTVTNALRRIILADIPYIATFRDEQRSTSSHGGFVVRINTGRLHDDMLVDRIALTPISLTREEVLNFIPGSITVDLRVANGGKFPLDVTSADFKVSLFGKPHPKGSACYRPCRVTGKYVLITQLFPGEKIDVTATLEKNTAAVHAAFAVASTVAVRPSLDEHRYEQAVKQIDANASRMSAKERAQQLGRLRHIGRHKFIDCVADGVARTTTLEVESECGLSADDIFAFAEEELMRKFTTDNVSFDSEPSKDGVVFTVHSQGHTFGSVLQEICMRDRCVLGIESIGYYLTHPIESTIVFRVALPGGKSEDTGDHAALFSRMRVHCAEHIGAALSAKVDGGDERLQQVEVTPRPAEDAPDRAAPVSARSS